MASLLLPTRTSSSDVRRPLTLLATAGGAAAAGAVLLTCMGLAVIGWFVSDGGVHGEPRDALRVASLAWLMAHGSGVVVEGARVTAVPLGLTLVCAWVTWRMGLRVGESVSGHGPDADALADGQRDWTVALATALFSAAYAVVAMVAGVLAGSGTTAPSLPSVLAWAVAVSGGIGGVAIAVGSGRAAVWLALVPQAVRTTAQATAAVVGWFLALAGALLLVALLLDVGAALNVFSRLHTSPGESVMLLVLIAALVPSAVVYAGAYLLGPGFAVGTGTAVSPSVVAIGPVPMFPLLAALPDNGPTAVWTPWLSVLPVLVAAVTVARAQRRSPVVAWDQALLRGGSAGVLAGLVVALLAALAGGAVGPGRMAHVGPDAGEVLVSAIVAFGIGGLLGSAYATWRARHVPEEAFDERSAGDAARDRGGAGALGRVTRPVTGVVGGAARGLRRLLPGRR
jgi:hypothetical protein